MEILVEPLIDAFSLVNQWKALWESPEFFAHKATNLARHLCIQELAGACIIAGGMCCFLTKVSKDMEMVTMLISPPP